MSCWHNASQFWMKRSLIYNPVGLKSCWIDFLHRINIRLLPKILHLCWFIALCIAFGIFWNPSMPWHIWVNGHTDVGVWNSLSVTLGYTLVGTHHFLEERRAWILLLAKSYGWEVSSLSNPFDMIIASMSRIIHYSCDNIAGCRWNNIETMDLSKPIEPMWNTKGRAFAGGDLMASGTCTIKYSAR